MANPVYTSNKSAKLQHLRELLLEEDRIGSQSIQAFLNDKDAFSNHLDPFFEEKLNNLKERFPKEYEDVIGRMIQQRLEQSQTVIVETLYPVLGKMIRKYIDFQMQILKESIEHRLAQGKKHFNIFQKARLWFSGVSESELYISEAKMPKIEEIFFVDHNSGLIMAHASVKENLNADAVAGMLTAIKAFMEDAFHQKGQELDYIQYANYKILVQNQNSYYIAALIDGSVDTRDRVVLAEKIDNFLIKIQGIVSNPNTTREDLSTLLNENFLDQ